MVSLIRSGPKILLLETTMEKELTEYLINTLNAAESNHDTALENSGEGYVIIFIVNQLKEIIGANDINASYILKHDANDFFCRILNDNMSNLISKCRMAPNIILMRTFGEVEKIIHAIKTDYSGITDNFKKILDTYNNQGTIVTFVDRPLNKNVGFKDMYDKAVFIKRDYHSLLRSLRLHGLKYLNEGIGNRDWYEIEIRIYDTFSAYKLHYKRLEKILDSLELGIILGESWGKDHPRFLMSVEVYRIRFFTFYSPEYIKKILVGLEHLDDNKRIVDYDVYFNRKKIDWQDVAEKNLRIRSHLSKKYREEILSKLDSSEKEELLALEERILASRIE